MYDNKFKSYTEAFNEFDKISTPLIDAKKIAEQKLTKFQDRLTIYLFKKGIKKINADQGQLAFPC